MAEEKKPTSRGKRNNVSDAADTVKKSTAASSKGNVFFAKNLFHKNRYLHFIKMNVNTHSIKF